MFTPLEYLQDETKNRIVDWFDFHIMSPKMIPLAWLVNKETFLGLPDKSDNLLDIWKHLANKVHVV